MGAVMENQTDKQLEHETDTGITSGLLRVSLSPFPGEKSRLNPKPENPKTPKPQNLKTLNPKTLKPENPKPNTRILCASISGKPCRSVKPNQKAQTP